MSGLAQILLEKDFYVSGSDVKETIVIDRIRNKGANVFIGHRKENLGQAEMIIFSSSISSDNPELVSAKRKNIPIWHRSQLLNEIIKNEESIIVCGAHGKTTTSSMIFSVLRKAGLEPSCIIGGELMCLSANAYLGKGRYYVVEGDESDGSFLNLEPKYSVITNIDREHLDFYRNFNSVVRAFGEFIKKTKNDGLVVCFGEDPNLRKILLKQKNYMTYGFGKGCDIIAKKIELKNNSSKFLCEFNNKMLGEVIIPMPGMHNILNALAAIGVAIRQNLDFEIISKALSEYAGVKRRFEIKASCGGVMLIDDYGHHPSEIKATIAAAREKRPKRLICIFQPHRFTRTKFLADEFADALNLADYLILTDIYSASEKPIKGVSADLIYQKVLGLGHKNARLLKKEKIAGYVLDILKKGDLILNMGAGDIEYVGEELAKGLKNKYA